MLRSRPTRHARDSTSLLRATPVSMKPSCSESCSSVSYANADAALVLKETHTGIKINVAIIQPRQAHHRRQQLVMNHELKLLLHIRLTYTTKAKHENMPRHIQYEIHRKAWCTTRFIIVHSSLSHIKKKHVPCRDTLCQSRAFGICQHLPLHH